MFKTVHSNIMPFYLFLYNRWRNKERINWNTDELEYKFIVYYSNNYVRDFWSEVYVNNIITSNNFSKILQKKFKTKDSYGIAACITLAKKLEENILDLLKLYDKENE